MRLLADDDAGRHPGDGFAREVSCKMVFVHQGVIEEEGMPQQMFGGPRSKRLCQVIKRVSG